MVSILPSITDRYRTKRNGQKRYVGQVFRFEAGKRQVIAEIYGDSLQQMRQRKHAATEALRQLESEPMTAIKTCTLHSFLSVDGGELDVAVHYTLTPPCPGYRERGGPLLSPDEPACVEVYDVRTESGREVEVGIEEYQRFEREIWDQLAEEPDR